MKKSIYVFALVGILGACGTSEVNPDILTYNGKTYKTVKIGEQVWMAENLNEDSESSFCYGNDDTNCVTYGRLYNLDGAVGIASKVNGWHLPTDDEWKALERYLGMSESDINKSGLFTSRTSGNVGNKLQKDSSSGFDALFGGVYNNREYAGLGEFTGFWCAPSNVFWSRRILPPDTGTRRAYDARSLQLSVRLIKD